MKDHKEIIGDIEVLTRQVKQRSVFHQAYHFIQDGRLDDARNLIQPILLESPEHADANHLMGVIAWHCRHYELAARLITRAIEKVPDNPVYHLNLCLALDRCGQLVEAMAECETAIRIKPDYPEAYNARGHVLGQLGQPGESEASFRQALQLKPDYAEAYRNMLYVYKARHGDGLVEKMMQLFSDQRSNPESCMQLGFALGKACSDLEDYKLAMSFYLEANHLKRDTYHYDLQEDRKRLDFLRDVLSKEFLSKHRCAGVDDDRPIFIVGMPRSGTTLVEQILASHPDVAGAGEFPYMEQIALHGQTASGPARLLWLVNAATPVFAEKGMEYLQLLRARAGSGVRHVTDKMPLNFWHIGLIHLVLPRARIVHIRRDPKDTCLSIFTHLFSGHHPYAYDLEELGGYYRIYTSLMGHWSHVLPGAFHTISYEELVADLETGVRGLLDYCNLPFDERCLAFNKSTRAVQTASAQQVRQSVYTNSIGRWRKFEDMLRPLTKSISEL